MARRGPCHRPTAPDSRRKDPGYYLLSAAAPGLKKQLRFRISFAAEAPAPLYFLGDAGLSGIAPRLSPLLFLAIPLYASLLARTSPLALAAFALLALIPASDLAVALVNRFVADSLGPQILPKIDFSSGVPEEFRTLVVMPTLLSVPGTVQENLERLEIHYLSNPDGCLQFALLMDFTDAPREQMPEGDTLLAAAREGIRRLNEKYP